MFHFLQVLQERIKGFWRGHAFVSGLTGHRSSQVLSTDEVMLAFNVIISPVEALLRREGALLVQNITDLDQSISKHPWQRVAVSVGTKMRYTSDLSSTGLSLDCSGVIIIVAVCTLMWDNTYSTCFCEAMWHIASLLWFIMIEAVLRPSDLVQQTDQNQFLVRSPCRRWQDVKTNRRHSRKMAFNVETVWKVWLKNLKCRNTWPAEKCPRTSS